MKKLLFTLFLFFPFFLFAQDNPFTDVFPMIDGKVNYTEVIQEQDVPAGELYKRAKIWMVDAFKSSKDVIQNDDKDNGIIIGKGFFSGLGHNVSVLNPKYWFTIRIDCRDGRYKYSITDFKYEFDIRAFGSPTSQHFNEDFSEWGNKSFTDYYQNLIDKKFPPNKERDEKQQKKYEELKEKFAKEQAQRYTPMKEHYLKIDAQVRSTIESLKKGMNKVEDNW